MEMKNRGRMNKRMRQGDDMMGKLRHGGGKMPGGEGRSGKSVIHPSPHP